MSPRKTHADGFEIVLEIDHGQALVLQFLVHMVVPQAEGDGLAADVTSDREENDYY